jgi:hypothetical protein
LRIREKTRTLGRRGILLGPTAYTITDGTRIVALLLAVEDLMENGHPSDVRQSFCSVRVAKGLRMSTLLALAAVGCGGGAEVVDATICESELRWTGGDSGDANMNPGEACVSCHQMRGGPSYTAAGTVFGGLHQTNDCFGRDGATVELTGADGAVHTATTSAAGNFYFQGPLSLPFRAAVIYEGQRVEMATPGMSGDCNSCHASTGVEGTRGRIVPAQLYEL